MKLSSTSVAKLLLILSIAIGAASIWKGLDWQSSSENLNRKLRTAEQEELKTRSQLSALVEVLPGDEAELPLIDTLVGVLATLNGEQLNNRVAIGPVTPADVRGSSAVDLLQLARPVTKTDLYRLTLTVRGTYREYAGLRRYLDAIDDHPVAITRLQIAGNSFELAIDVFGTI